MLTAQPESCELSISSPKNEIGRSLPSPVVADLCALGGFSGRWISADWAPDLRLELAGRNIIADEVVV
jgi:hypothetical protein